MTAGDYARGRFFHLRRVWEPTNAIDVSDSKSRPDRARPACVERLV